MTENSDDVKRMTRRRTALKTLGAGAVVVLAGCSSTGNDSTPPDTTTPPDTPTDTATEEPTETSEPDKSFREIYLEDIEEGESGLARKQAQNYYDRMESEDYESFSHLLEDMSVTIANNSHADPGTQQFTNLWKYAIHNDLELSSDDIRILGRDTAGGGTYTAIFHKNDDGDWIKDLAVGGEWEEGYLRHNETGDEVDHNHESEDGLWNLWERSKTTAISATAYFGIKNSFGDRDKAKESAVEDAREHIDKGNDHIVVGDEYEEAVVDYAVPGAERVANIMNWHENDAFNEEMALIEEATENYHNSEEPYLEIQVQDGEETAVPTEEHNGPGQIYDFLREN